VTTRLSVNAASPYDVVVGPGATHELPRLLEANRATRVAVIHPPTLRDRAERLRAQVVTDRREVHLIEVPDGESAKSIEVLSYCWKVLGSAGFTRSDAIVGLGGGSTTDLAGFVAASWLRGVPFINLPTTVLGMVDAAVGGKTGINTDAGKNLVGAFHEPAAVLCDLDVLTSLSQDEIRSGMAEVVKCGFIADPSILELVEHAPGAVLDATSALIAELITKGIAVKIATVEQDLKETGAGAAGIGREALNYGHTLGHALERVHGYGLRHGEAISVGMVFAAELAHRTGNIDDALLARHREILTSLGLPTTTAASFPPLLSAMRVDKKSRGNTLRFVVLDGLANPVILEGPDDLLLRDAFAAVSAR
jgi:3-dehydroquinate synthase